jgi:6-phosphofructo-2-kinase
LELDLDRLVKDSAGPEVAAQRSACGRIAVRACGSATHKRVTMAEVIHEDDVIADQRSSDQAIKQGLSKTITRRINKSKKTATPRVGGQVEVCGTVYKNFMDDDSDVVLESTTELVASAKRTSQEKRKLVIIMVGLPGRGKTYLCNKLMCYLNWCAPVQARPRTAA